MFPCRIRSTRRKLRVTAAPQLLDRRACACWRTRFCGSQYPIYPPHRPQLFKAVKIESTAEQQAYNSSIAGDCFIILVQQQQQCRQILILRQLPHHLPAREGQHAHTPHCCRDVEGSRWTRCRGSKTKVRTMHSLTATVVQDDDDEDAGVFFALPLQHTSVLAGVLGCSSGIPGARTRKYPRGPGILGVQFPQIPG